MTQEDNEKVGNWFRETDLRWRAHERVHDELSNDLVRRFENVNKLRDQLTAERANLVTFELYNREHSTLVIRVNEIEKIVANYAGRWWMFATGVTVVSTIITIVVNLILRK